MLVFPLTLKNSVFYGHHVHLDEPEVVADAVRDLVMAEREKLAFAVRNK